MLPRFLLVALALLLVVPMVPALPLPLPSDCDTTSVLPGTFAVWNFEPSDARPALDATVDCVAHRSLRLGSAVGPDSHDPVAVRDDGMPAGALPSADRHGGAFDMAPVTGNSSNGAARWLEFPSSPAWKTLQFTWMAWVKADSFLSSPINQPNILGSEVGYSERGSVALYLRNDAGCMEACQATAGWGFTDRRCVLNGGFEYVDSITKIDARAWHHIAGTFDGATLVVYVDGVPSGALAVVPDCFTWGSAPLSVGARSGLGDKPFDGRIDSVKLFTLALTPAEVVAAMMS